jgi:hypothetical protein
MNVAFRPPALKVQHQLPLPLNLLRWVLATVLTASFFVYVVYSWHWPLVWDMQVIHYVSFLMDHGWAPYRQIGDMNMPGAYIFEHAALHLYGSSDLGWRFYDFTLCAVATLSMIAIARPYDWVAGLCAGGLFTLFHAAEGPISAGQRDQVMAVVMVVGFALCLEALRLGKPWLMGVFGLATAMATAIKPTLILAGPILLVLACMELRRRRSPMSAYILWTLAGFAAATAIVLRFLISWGSLEAFINLLTQVLPHYAKLEHLSFLWVLGRTLPNRLYVFVALAAAAVVLQLIARYRATSGGPASRWEESAILLGAFFGLLSYLGQRIGAAQHRYPFIAFILLWASIRLFRALRASGPPRIVAVVALVFALLVCVPSTLIYTRSYPSFDHFSHTLESDLKLLGAPRLQNEVQCLDIVDGCLTALYHLQIVQRTGSTGDLLLFQPKEAEAVDKARADYAQTLERTPPDIIVMSNWQYGVGRDFNKVCTWPAFAHYLAENYIDAAQREFPTDTSITSHPGTNPSWPAYRIYIRRGSALTDSIPALQRAVPTP